jgi:hypothetical protein
VDAGRKDARTVANRWEASEAARATAPAMPMLGRASLALLLVRARSKSLRSLTIHLAAV